MKVKKGDNVLITAGKDKGRTGKIMKAMPKSLQVLVEGLNLKKKHVRPKREGEKGQVVEIPAALNVSDVKLICPKCGKVTRVGYKIVPQGGIPQSGKKDTKQRVCKKCNQAI